MKVTVKLFANLKGIAGSDTVELQLDDNKKIVDLLAEITKILPPLKDVLESRKVFVSLNQEMAQKDDILKDGDEVGLLPPFSGG